MRCVCELREREGGERESELVGAFNIYLTDDISLGDDPTVHVYLHIIKRMQVPLDVTLTLNAPFCGFI